jgi:hypothetical protein
MICNAGRSGHKGLRTSRDLICSRSPPFFRHNMAQVRQRSSRAPRSKFTSVTTLLCRGWRCVASLMVLNRGERLGLHDVGIKSAVEMVDLVLQNPRIPACGVDHTLISMLIQAGHPNRGRSLHHRHQARNTETAFMERNVRRCEQLYLRVDDYLKVDGKALALTQLFGCEAFLIFGLIFNHSDLKRFSNLRRGQTHPWSIPHGIAHVPNQILDVFTADFIRG